ncbi:MAG: pimeloyl-ACP methyl ester carboxylesterase [Cryomorphaceae bacterium]|jgi:pimeloyl-ACP methyl ester carboxylesterase
MYRAKEIASSEAKNLPHPKSPPSTAWIIAEARAGLDVASVPFSLIKSWLGKASTSSSNERDSSKLPIILLPGFASDERYMKPLAKHLEHLGYYTEDWGLGMNMAGTDMPHTLDQLADSWNAEPYEGYTEESYRGDAGVPFLCDVMTQRVKQRAEELGSKVVLIGWSLGGFIAREVARDLADDVAHVITLGSPIIGGPKYTKAATFFEAKGYNLQWIERESAKRDAIPIQQPITAIYSKTDGIVDWRSAIDKISPNATHWQINAPHLGMGFNSKVWKLIRQSLAQYGQADT